MQLSEAAQELLARALEGNGSARGLLLVVPIPGGVFVRAGDYEQRLFGEDSAALRQAHHELMDADLIVEIVYEEGPGGHMVTPMGSWVAGWRPVAGSPRRGRSNQVEI